MAPPLKFWVVEKFSSWRKFFLYKTQNLRLKTTILAKYRGKVEILSTHNLLRQKFVTVCRNSVGNLELSALSTS